MTKKNLHSILLKYLQTTGYKIIKYTDKFIIAEGNLPICLISHMDTVFNHQPHEFFYDDRKKVLWSPYGSGFDDRAGIYGIIQCIEAGYKPHIVFTDDEEKGGIGAKELIEIFPDCPFSDCRCLIELDRANKMDSVFYDCDNKDFEKYINKFGFKTDWGTFSDISIIAPRWKIAAVNLSIGYVDEHTGNERLYCVWCDQTIKKVKKILEKASDMLSYGYIPIIYNTKYYDKLYKSQNFYDFPSYEEITRFSYCLLCGKSLKENDKEIIPDESYPYAVCKKCFNSYYDKEKVYKGGYIN